MTYSKILLLPLIALFSIGCKSNPKTEVVTEQIEVFEEEEKLTTYELAEYETAYFASGCFWCVEAIFESVKGVKEVVSGYSGGKIKNPTYEQVGYGKTTHAEAVEVFYDPKEISYNALVEIFFGSHDPTTLNQQGPDKGTQYRSIAFYKNATEKNTLENFIKALEDNKAFDGKKISTEVTAFNAFYKAEEYHQDYEKRNPNNSYVRGVSIPRLNRFKKLFPQYLKNKIH